MKRSRLAMLAAALLLAPGCASTPPEPAGPARAQRAIAENNRAGQFFARGQYEEALEHYREALALAESIEDEDAIAANLVNLSVVQQRMGERTGAIESAERVLGERNLTFPRRRIAEAALRRALLAVEAGDVATAVAAADRAEAECLEPCALRAKLLGVRGYVAVSRADGAAAERLGREAIALFRGTPDREELANGLRLLGAAALLQGDPARALAPLAEALAIDKQLALPRAIANDLIALARAYAALRDGPQARAHFERAVAVAAADGNSAALAQAKQGLAPFVPAAEEGSPPSAAAPGK